MKKTLHSGLTPQQFVRDYWKKIPLLIRHAVSGFKGLLNSQQLIKPTCDDNVQAPIVTQQRDKFTLQHLPFVADDFQYFGKAKWSVLVQGVNHSLPTVPDLFKLFNFIPHAQLDGLMVSHTPKDKRVGPRFDAYELFLLHKVGRRRWQISTQNDQTLIERTSLPSLIAKLNLHKHCNNSA